MDPPACGRVHFSQKYTELAYGHRGHRLADVGTGQTSGQTPVRRDNDTVKVKKIMDPLPAML